MREVCASARGPYLLDMEVVSVLSGLTLRGKLKPIAAGKVRSDHCAFLTITYISNMSGCTDGFVDPAVGTRPSHGRTETGHTYSSVSSCGENWLFKVRALFKTPLN
jgi:hypothetical protein